MTIIEKQTVFMELDLLDQQQIVAAATGEVIDELVYKVKGKNAISWAGINHISFFMGDIEVDDWVQWERIEMFGDRVYWSATIRARNTKYGLSSLGTAEAPELADTYVLDDENKRVKDLDGNWKMTTREDPHCRRKALSMAQRNGKRAVMPAVVLEKWLGYFLDLKKGEKVDPPFQPKYVESTQTVKKEPEKKKPKEKKTPKETPLVDPDEERVKTTLAVNDIPIDDLTIYKYIDKVRVVPKPKFPQENFDAYNGAITDLLKAEWVAKEGWWEVSY